MSLSDLRQMCVTAFSASTKRPVIMQGLESVIQKLLALEIRGDLWVDGSFLTEKINPNDVDVVLHISPDFMNAATAEQKQMLRWLDEESLKEHYQCDSYVWYEYAQDDPLAVENEWHRAYWVRQYGWSRDAEMKGIALISLPEGVP